MQTSTDETKAQTHLARVQALLGGGTLHQIDKMVNSLQPVEIARLLESSPPPSRNVIWDLVDKEAAGEVLEELPEDIQAEFIRNLDAEQLIELTEGLETDDVVDILQQLPEKITQEVLGAMTEQDRARVEIVLAYDEDTAGGLTNTDTITVRPSVTVDVVLRYLRRHVELPPSTDALIVVNRKDHFLGMLPLATILTADPATTVRDVMMTDTNAIPATMPDSEVAKLFEQNDWVSAPVVDDQGTLLGRITIDDVVDVIRESADHSFMSLAGLDEEEDTFSPVMRTIPRRAIWLGINLLTVIFVASVIKLFQDTLDQVVTLAILMPIVASMGGVAGTQTLTVVIRGMAVGHIGWSNMRWLLSREVRVGLLNGCLWAVVMGAVAAVWFDDLLLAYIIAAAMLLNLVVAALAGAMLPIILKQMKIDPALAGGVTLTTITDVVGFVAFLGLATYFYA